MYDVDASENISTAKLEVTGDDVAIAGYQYNKHRVIECAVVIHHYARDISDMIDEVNHCVDEEAKCLSSNVNFRYKMWRRLMARMVLLIHAVVLPLTSLIPLTKARFLVTTTLELNLICAMVSRRNFDGTLWAVAPLAQKTKAKRRLVR